MSRLVQRAGVRVLEHLGDRIGGVLFVGADHAARAALDPADHVLAAMRALVLVAYPPTDVPDQAASSVERDVVDGPTAIADRAQDQAAVDLLSLISGHRA